VGTNTRPSHLSGSFCFSRASHTPLCVSQPRFQNVLVPGDETLGIHITDLPHTLCLPKLGPIQGQQGLCSLAPIQASWAKTQSNCGVLHGRQPSQPEVSCPNHADSPQSFLRAYCSAFCGNVRKLHWWTAGMGWSVSCQCQAFHKAPKIARTEILAPGRSLRICKGVPIRYTTWSISTLATTGAASDHFEKRSTMVTMYSLPWYDFGCFPVTSIEILEWLASHKRLQWRLLGRAAPMIACSLYVF